MPKQVQIGNTIHIIPEPGDKAGWGEDTTEWMCDVTDALADVQGPNDILITSATLANNQATPTNIPGLQFDTSEVQGVEVDYFIIRVYDLGASTTVETGKILGAYDGTEFFISTDSTGEAGVTISVTNAGQFQYISSDLTNHQSSTIRFRGKTIDQP